MLFHFGYYPFLIEDLVWPHGYEHLPDCAEVDLPAALVDADGPEFDDRTWDLFISIALANKFDVCPVEFGSFGPAD
jgi:hypothetical protein